MKPVVVLTTVGPDFDARALARSLVDAHLAACVNIFDGIHSIYRWEGRVSADDEQLLLIKTVDERLVELRELLLGLHPYDVPEFIVLPIESTSEAYGAWILDAVTPG
jgi:periplasmic divalent cation tolerance protein